MKHFLIAGILAMIATSVLAQHNGHPPEHQTLHNEFYSKLKIPNTKMSCCNDKDCRPARHRMKYGNHEFYVRGRWVQVAQGSIIDDQITPDGQSHWCGIYYEGQIDPTTFCGIVAPKFF